MQGLEKRERLMATFALYGVGGNDDIEEAIVGMGKEDGATAQSSGRRGSYTGDDLEKSDYLDSVSGLELFGVEAQLSKIDTTITTNSWTKASLRQTTR
jgi:hypothetical protein